MSTQADTLETQEASAPVESQTDFPEAGNGAGDPNKTANGTHPDGDPATEGVPGEGDDSDTELTLQFGDEVTPPSEDQEHREAPQWVKELRRSDREKARRIRELEAQLKTPGTPKPAVPVLGAKPTLESHDYDEGKYEQALEKWYETKRQVDEATAESKAQEAARVASHQTKVEGYHAEAKTLGVKDFKDAEDEFVAAMSVEQQGIVLGGADKPALLIYALGRNPAKLKTLASITDPARFAFAAAKLEKELKVTSTRAAKPAPETRVSSSSGAPATGASQRKLEQLRAQAEKSGDYSQVHAYKRQMKEAERRR